ncbi:MAG: hypothetical protein H6667_17550 [Ardenticatenaceae bacterium]|nr:hypothetical protein [Ardenticatenaceae bacterium]
MRYPVTSATLSATIITIYQDGERRSVIAKYGANSIANPYRNNANESFRGGAVVVCQNGVVKGPNKEKSLSVEKPVVFIRLATGFS